MTPADFPEFYEEWLNAHAMSSSNKEPKESTVQAVFDVLIDFPLRHVLGALQVHAKKSRFAPTPADICEIIESRTRSKHIGSDEAWALAKRSFDEAETVVMTDEIFQARNEAWSVWVDGDTIGARMTFKSAYERIIETAGNPVWHLVSGWDSSLIQPAIDKAKQQGRLPADYKPSKHALPAPEAQTTVTALLENLEQHIERTETDTQEAKRNIANIRAFLNRDEFADGIASREKKRQEFELHRQSELSRLAQKAGELH